MLADAARIVVTGATIVYLLGTVAELAGHGLLHYKPHLAPSKVAGIDIAVRAVTDSNSTRSLLLRLPMLPALATLWPLGVVRPQVYRGRLSDLDFWSRLTLRPQVLLVSAAGLTLAVVSALLTEHRSLIWSDLLVLVLAYTLVAIVLKHLYYSFRSLPSTLRRSLMNAFGVFVTVAVMDALALVLLVTSLRFHVGAQSEIPWPEALTASAADLFAVPSNLAEVASLGPAEFVVAAIGLVYSVALARSVAQPGQFLRTDEDKQALAQTLANIGDYERAEAFLDQVRNVSVSTLEVRARIALSRRRFDQAVQYLRRVADMKAEDGSEDAATVSLAWMSTIDNLDAGTRHELVCHLLGKRVPDVVLVQAVTARSQWVAHHADESEAFIEEEIAELPSSYPLSKAALLCDAGRLSEATSLLRSVRPDLAVEELLRISFLLRLRVVDPDLTWTETLDAVTGLVEEYPLDSVAGLANSLSPLHRRVAGIDVLSTEAWLRLLLLRSQNLALPVEHVEEYRSGLDDLSAHLIESSGERNRVRRVALESVAFSSGEPLSALRAAGFKSESV